MRDYEQLTGRPQLLIDLQQTTEVRVVERGLYLVQDVERAGSCDEERYQETDRHQSTFPSGQQRKALDLLPRRPRLDVNSGRQPVAGLGQDQPTFTAREESREHALERCRDIGIGLGEDPLDSVVDLDDDVEEVPPSLPQILQLLGEEPVSLLKRVELLQRKRVDPTQQAQFTLGGPQPLELLVAHIAHRLGL